MKAFKNRIKKIDKILSLSSQQIDLSKNYKNYGIKTNKYFQTSLIYIDVIDAQ